MDKNLQQRIQEIINFLNLICNNLNPYLLMMIFEIIIIVLSLLIMVLTIIKIDRNNNQIISLFSVITSSEIKLQ